MPGPIEIWECAYAGCMFWGVRSDVNVHATSTGHGEFMLITPVERIMINYDGDRMEVETMDLDSLNNAMSRRARALSRVAYWTKQVNEAEEQVQAIINGTYTAPEPAPEPETLDDSQLQ